MPLLNYTTTVAADKSESQFYLDLAVAVLKALQLNHGRISPELAKEICDGVVAFCYMATAMAHQTASTEAVAGEKAGALVGKPAGDPRSYDDASVPPVIEVTS